MGTVACLAVLVRQKNPETGVEEDVRDTEHINIQVPLRKRGRSRSRGSMSGEYEDLPGFFRNIQAYIEKDDNELLFGDRINPVTLKVSEARIEKY